MLKYDNNSEYLWQMHAFKINKDFLILVIFKGNLLSVKINSLSKRSGYFGAK